MALVELRVQGADGVKRDVLLDEIIVGGTVLYALPGYKLNLGAEGTDDGFVGKTNPLPTKLISPLTAFGEVSVATLTPAVQLQFPYGLSDELIVQRNNNGSASIVANKLHVSTGAGANQSAEVLSLRVLKYSPGQGALARFTALYTTGVIGSHQYAGIGNHRDGFFFGFDGATFGILRRQGGVPEVRTLTVATGSSDNENITITLDGNAKTDVVVTNTADVTLTANEIADADYSAVGKGWDAHSVGDKVTFESYDTAEGKTGTYSLSSTSSSAGSFAQTLAAVAATETFIAQADFNVDVLDGTGVSATILDPTKGNVYQIP